MTEQCPHCGTRVAFNGEFCPSCRTSKLNGSPQPGYREPESQPDPLMDPVVQDAFKQVVREQLEAGARSPAPDGPWLMILTGACFMAASAWAYWYCSTWEQDPPHRINAIFAFFYLVGGKWGPSGAISLFGFYYLYHGVRRLLSQRNAY